MSGITTNANPRAGIDQFIEEIRSCGLTPPDAIKDDGKLHRFSSSDKSRDDAGWYIYHGDGIPAGAFGCWRASVAETWRMDMGRTLTQEESAACLIKAEAMRLQRDAEKAQRHAKAATKASAIWENARPASDDHPYLARKGVKAHGIRLHDGELVIPMRDGGDICSTQSITAEGEKLFQAGGRVAGCYYTIGVPNNSQTLCVCEGFATGATIHEATGHPVVVAFNAGNLEAVATAIHVEFPQSPIVVCADDDVLTEGNPGRTKATAAALAVGGLLAVPDFGSNRPSGATDFNDMAAHRDLDAVKHALASAAAPGDRLDDHLVDLDDMTGCDEPHPHFVANWIPEGEVTLLAGHGGAGKSFVALVVAVFVALGIPFAGLMTKQASTLFYSAEDGSTALKKRLAKICGALKVEVASLKGKLHLLDVSDLDPALHREQRGRQPVDTETLMLAKLSEMTNRFDIGFVVIDNASDAYDDDEIKRANVRRFTRSLRTRIARPGRSVLLLAHINKESAKHGRQAGTEDYSGSTAWHNGVRSRLSLIPDGANMMKIEHVKANLGPKAEPVFLEWQDGVPLPAGTNPMPGAELRKAAMLQAEAARDEADNDALIAIIDDFDRRGQRVPTSTMGAGNVYKTLKDERLFPKNMGPDRLKMRLRALEDDGRIFRRNVKTPDRKIREAFTRLPAPAVAPMARNKSTAVAAVEAGRLLQARANEV